MMAPPHTVTTVSTVSTVAVPDRRPLGHWVNPMCSCCGPPNGCAGCCLACCCPSCMFGHINGMLTTGRDQSLCAGNCAGSCLLHWLSGGCIALALYSSGLCIFMPFIGLIRCDWIFQTQSRKSIRLRFNLPQKPCQDCCVSYWCGFCDLAQQKNELDQRIIQGEFTPFGNTLASTTTVTYTTAPPQQQMPPPHAAPVAAVPSKSVEASIAPPMMVAPPNPPPPPGYGDGVAHGYPSMEPPSQEHPSNQKF